MPKTLIQGVIALICDVMAGWPPPQPIERVSMMLEQLCITNFTFIKRRLTECQYKTLHVSGICLLVEREKLAHSNVLSQQPCRGMRGFFKTHTTHIQTIAYISDALNNYVITAFEYQSTKQKNKKTSVHGNSPTKIK